MKTRDAIRSLKNRSGLILAVLLIHATAFAAKNPLSPIPADSFDKKTAGIKIEPCSEGGNNLCSIQDGDYVVYKNCDFDSGVAACNIRISTQNKGDIEIRLDSLSGPLMGECTFNWQSWEDVTCKVDNSLAGVRDVYLIFKLNKQTKLNVGQLVKVRSLVFLKSIAAKQTALGFSSRVDQVDDEPQAKNAWGMPEAGFNDSFESGRLDDWMPRGMIVTTNAIDGAGSAEFTGTNFSYAFTPNVYINKTDTGGEWRTLAEASLSADLVLDAKTARPGLGFISKDNQQYFYVVLNAASNSIEAWRKLSDGSLTQIKQHQVEAVLQSAVKYRLQIDWSPYSDALIAFLYDGQGAIITSFRTEIDLPVARRPLLVAAGGPARFDDVKFDPTLDARNYKWQWKKAPVLTPDVCNPTVWKWKDGKYYMMWRKFGMDTYHGVAMSTNGIDWIRVTDEALKCTGDMNALVNPFGDGLMYVTGGSANMSWWTSDGSNNFTTWTETGLNLGSILGNSRIQEIIDTKQHPQMTAVSFNGTDYRFIAFTENWVDAPVPHTVILLSNTLTNWILGNPDPVIPPGTSFWGEKGNAIGSAFVLPDGNILVANCACPPDGYSGSPEPSNVSAIVDGKQPWKILKLGVLPDAPVSRENVWYEGPNFGTAFFYQPEIDTLFFYGGFHDYHIGVMRVQNFLHAKPLLISPEINTNGVIFRLKAPQAKAVQLVGGWSHWQHKAMNCDDEGVWSVKVDALPPGVWEYHFSVDGLDMIDPLNPAIKPERSPHTSMLHIAANPPAPWDDQNVPHGVLHTQRYFSKTLGYAREVVVYTPAGYDKAARPLPVLYLAHGSGDNERTWTTLGKAHWIADALIAAKRAKPMIIVMSDSYALPVSNATSTNYGPANIAAFIRNLREEVRPLIEKNYRVRTDAQGRAFAGLSMGGQLAFAVAMNYPDEFAWVAPFSPAPLSDTELHATLASPDSMNSHLRYFSVSIGRDDFLLPKTEPFVSKLKAAGIKIDWHLTDGDHSWPVWRNYLTDLLPRLFR